MPSLAEEKRRERERRLSRTRSRSRVRVAAVALLVGAAVAGVVWLYRSDVFKVTEIDVTGAKRLSADQVKGLAAVPKDATLLDAPLESIEKRVKSSPWVAGVKVTRDFPHTLRIAVEERKPFAGIEVGRVAYLVDDQGVVLVAEPATSTLLPLIKALPLESRPLPSQRLASRELANALAVLGALPADLGSRVSLVYAPTVDDLRLVTKQGLEIVFGRAEQLEEKRFAVEKVIKDSKDKVIIKIDVRAPDVPGVTYAP